MSFSVALSINDNAANVPERLRALVTGDDLKAVMGRAVRNDLVAHFVELGNTRHRPAKSGPSFYGEVRRGVQQPQIEGDSVTVSVNHIGIAQRLFGGTIKPGAGKQWLTIPNPDTPGTIGKRAGEFDDLHFAPFGPELAALVRLGPLETRVSKKGNVRQIHVGKPVVVFWLKREIIQEPDPSVLPPEDELLATALMAAQKRVSRLQARSVATDAGTTEAPQES